MRFERALNLLLYRAVEDFRKSGKYSFEVRTNAKLKNPITGATNLAINVKNKKSRDGVNMSLSRPDVELEDSESGFWIIGDAKNYSSTNIPSLEEMLKDIKCRYKRNPKYAPTVGLMVCSTN
jgi:hypothetical protein